MDQLDNILDRILDDVIKENPDKSDFENAFMALHINITVLVNSLVQVGLAGNGLDNNQLYGLCSGLVTTCQWMASKEMAADTMRDIENGLT